MKFRLPPAWGVAAVAAMFAMTTQAANMSPVTVTGFNVDVVIENTASGPPYSSYASELNPGEGLAFYQAGLPGKTYGMPTSGGFTSALDGATVFQLQSYTSPNALVLSSGTGLTAGTLTLSSPAMFSRIAVVANSASANSSSAGTLTFNFTDSTTYVTTYNAPDWFNNSGAALGGTERISLSNGSTSGAATNPRFYQTTIDLTGALGPNNKPIASITFGKASGANSTGIYAVSGEVAPPTPPAFVTNPTNTTAYELTSANFSAVVSGSPFPYLQWQKNAAPISGATNSTLNIPGAALADNGALFRLVASNVVNSVTYVVTSTPAMLTVTADTNKPVLLAAQSLGLTQVLASFSERISPNTATNRTNYRLTGTNGGIPIASATLDASQSNVVLNTATMLDRAPYTLTLNNLTDQSAAANVIATNSQAQFTASVYTPWAIGSPTPAGGQTPAGNGLNISGGGSDLGGTNDQFQFSYIPVTGDFDYRVRLDSLSLADAWSEAAMLVREDLTPGARAAAAVATPSISGCYFQSRGTTNGTTALSGAFPVNYPNTWLRLKRSGNDFTGFAGFDGANWTQLGTANMALAANLYLGFAVSSHNTSQTATGAFRDFSTVTNSGATPALTFEPLTQSSRRTSLIFSEIMYHPTNTLMEFVELFNTRGEFQDLSGYQIGGDINYTFPPNTILPGGGFIVVAKSPADVQAAYAITGVQGPYSNSLPNSGGKITLLNQAGGVFLEVQYADSPPWPVAADGAGHSLVLAHSSYGENNPAAWAASDSVGGSPGKGDPFTPDPLRNVVINEFLAHTDLPDVDYVELYNHSAQPVDISGCILSDDPVTNKFVFPPGTILPPGGFISYTENTVGFSLSALGETIYFKNPSASRVLDVVRFEAQENGVSMGRYPDGDAQFYRLATKTPGATNAPIRVSNIVINELMYHPISEDDNDQYVELYNRGGSSVNLGGWTLSQAIDYTFPSNTVVAPGGYLVVAKSITQLLSHYANLNSGNTLGNFSGKLSGGGERLVLTMPDTSLTTNGTVVVTNLLHIAVDEVTYGTGGRWAEWADGGGSSLELIDPHSNHRLPSNWGDSDETHKSAWSQVSVTGRIDNGNVAADQLQALLLGAGECLIDNVQVISPFAGNLITNSTFETGSAGWTAEGTESRSSLESTEGYLSSKSYHLRVVDRGDNEINRVRTALSSALTNLTPNVTIQANVRWLKGHPELSLRLRGNWLECVGQMAVPTNLGTPGAQNSRFAANAGPTITAVQHSPVLPADSQPIVVSAKAADPDGIASVSLNYRADPAAFYSSLVMKDDGTGGDAVAGDGVYTATIPGQTSGTLIAFSVQAVDKATPGLTAFFPADAPTHECLVRVGELQPPGNLPVYRMWMTAATLNTWNSRSKLDNTPLDVTFVLGNQRVIYNTQAKYAGSPYISPGYSGATSARCGYSITTPNDEIFLGENDLVLDWPGGHGAGTESTGLQEQMGYWIADRLNLPFSHRYTIRLHVNGVTDDARHALFEAVMQPSGGGFVDEWAPGNTGGPFFKIERAYEFNDSGSLVGDPEPRLQNYTTVGGAKKIEKYRWNFLYRGAPRQNNYTNIFAWVDAMNSTQPEPYNSAVDGEMDTEECMRMFATEHIIMNFDAYGHEIGKNMYAYLPPGGKWQLYMFDLDWLMLAAQLSHGLNPLTAPLFNADDPTIVTFYNFPRFARAYWRAVQDAVNGPLLAANCNPLMDAKYASLAANGIVWCDNQALTDPTAVKNWFNSRRTGLQNMLNTVASPFTVNPVVITNGMALLSGYAPIGAKDIALNGALWSVTWNTVTSWTATASLQLGSNYFSVVGLDRGGKPLAGASNAVSVIYNTNNPSPVGVVVFNELMSNPALPDAEYVELFNTSSNYAFDLSGWEVNGLGYTFPEGASIAPRGYLVLAKDRVAFDMAYGAGIFVLDQYDGNLQSDGETLTLFKPNPPGPDIVVDRVRYETNAPWGLSSTGLSFQVRDATQDNSRAGNWMAAAPTPGAANLLVTNLPPFPTVWLNELQPTNLTGPLDNFGEREPWVELYNPGTNPISLAGLFLSDTYTILSKWAFPSNATLAAGAFMIVWCDGQTNQTASGSLHTSFRPAPFTGSIALARVFSNAMQVVDYLNYSSITANYSYGDVPDGQPFYRQMMYRATPAGTNNAALPPITVAINEWMAENTSFLLDAATAKYDDWFELYNPSNTPALLGGYYLTDDLTNQFQFQIPSGYSIPPHGFLLVWADGKPSANSTNDADLHVPFKLSKDGEAIGLFAPDGSTIDALVFGSQTNNISEGRYPDGGALRLFMPTPSPRAPNILPPAPTPPSVTGISFPPGGPLNITFATWPGHSYRVDYKTDLNVGNWIALTGNIFANGNQIVVNDPSPSATRRFYRIVQTN